MIFEGFKSSLFLHSYAQEDLQPLHSSVSAEPVPTPEHSMRKSNSSGAQQLVFASPDNLVSTCYAKKRKMKKCDELEEVIIKNLQDMGQRRVMDEDELFGQAIAATLHRFSNRQKAHAKLHIQSLLLEIEFHLNRLTHPSSSLKHLN